jgi:hypothetical protein
VFDVAVKLFKQRGVRALYQGLGATLVRNVCGNTAYFYFYELLKRRIAGAQNGGGGGGGGGGGKNVGFLPVLTAGGCAGIMYWVCCYPFDIIKSKMQTDAVMPSERRYRYGNHINECNVHVHYAIHMQILYKRHSIHNDTCERCARQRLACDRHHAGTCWTCSHRRCARRAWRACSVG